MSKKQQIIIFGLVLLILFLLMALFGLNKAPEQPEYIDNREQQAMAELPPGEKTTVDPDIKVKSFARGKNNKPPKNTFWLGGKFQNLEAIGSETIVGYSVSYVPPQQARRLEGGDGPSIMPAIIVQTTQGLNLAKEANASEAFVRSGTMKVNGKTIRLYSDNHVTVLPSPETKKTIVISAKNLKLLKAAVENVVVSN